MYAFLLRRNIYTKITQNPKIKLSENAPGKKCCFINSVYNYIFNILE